MNYPSFQHLLVDVSTQRLHHFKESKLIKTYKISTAANGVGEQINSECTPRGWHKIRAKIGEGCAANTIFVGRRATGEIYSPELAANNSNRDWILTRIMWLSGLEVGKNRLGSCDTMRRYIYMHGVPDEKSFDHPGSKGCINMRNSDIIELFDEIVTGTTVYIRGPENGK